MSDNASFTVEVDAETHRQFASLSGDWNPLHTDPAYASGTAYGRPVLHGAFSAGLVSRMAGMELPGRECLLHNMRLRFVAPILPPATLMVTGTVIADDGTNGRVEVTITDTVTGRRYVEASYDFGRHTHAEAAPIAKLAPIPLTGEAVVLVTGATGAIGSALLDLLGARGLGLTRGEAPGLVSIADPVNLDAALPGRRIAAIVHCGWPAMDKDALIDLPDAGAAIDHHVAGPLHQMIALARLLSRQGEAGAPLVLIGSTAAEPGRHAWRMPLYSLAKSMVPTLARILAFELAATGQRCMGVTFDMIDDGMNKGLSPALRQANADRSPAGRLPSAQEAAGQIAWLLDNSSFLASGATLALTGAAMP